MIHYVEYKDLNNKSIRVKFDAPGECPMCHGTIEPVYLTGNYDDAEKNHFSVFYYCKHCRKTFISRYTFSDIKELNGSYNYYVAHLDKSEPIGFVEIKMPEHVSKLSQRFVTIYNQAAKAEALELDEICGSGYRKSLEILVKDYAIHENPDKETEIKDSLLSKCINEYISDDSTKAPALVAAWAGNDETHYTKKMEKLDIDSLKEYIHTFVYFVEYHLSSEEALDLIKEKSKKNNQ